MIDSKLTKKELTAKLIEAEQDSQRLFSENCKYIRERDELQKIREATGREVLELHEALTRIRTAIQVSQAVCYPESSLYHGESNKGDPKEFLLLKYIYNQANNGS